MRKAKASNIYQLEEAWGNEFIAKYTRMMNVCYRRMNITEIAPFVRAFEAKHGKGIYPRGRAYQRLMDREYIANTPIWAAGE
ncbi:hypothetical protein VPZ60_004231 [Salmonella enterica]|nr:hypothetical protein [Salmonella enterica]